MIVKRFFMRHLKPEISNALIWLFVQDSVNSLRAAIPSAGYRKIFWEYYYVQTNVLNSVRELSDIDVDADFLSFPQIQKNNRIAIEAAVDLYNLCRDPDYIGVICHNAGIPPQDYRKYLVPEDFSHVTNPQKYQTFLEKSPFYTLSSKIRIAGKNGLPDERYHIYKAASQESNQYMHPNVFLSPLSPEGKEAKVRGFLNLNLALLLDCYHDLCVSLSNGWIFRPCSVSNQCNGNCLQCYQDQLIHIQQLLQAELFTQVQPQLFWEQSRYL